MTELRQVLFDWIVEREPAFVKQQENGAAGREFGVRHDAKQMPFAKRHLTFAIRPADAVQVGDFGSGQHG